jgi:hypothetical protein
MKLRSREDIPAYLNKIGLSGIGAEIGVKEGYFSNRILTKWKGKMLLMVDPWKHMTDWSSDINVIDSEMEEVYKKAMIAVNEFEGRFKVLRMTSEEASKHVDDESLDFVYIDANHDYSHVCEDLFYWYPKVKKGGLMSGHDYLNIKKGDIITGSDVMCPEDVDVKSAVDEFAKNLGVKIETTLNDYWFEMPFNSWFFMKK